jgi:two-component system, NtrC family, response regulator PilR
VAVNCGAIPQELVESELFGHRKGSFTGALSDKEGLFQAAQGGTLFLDEVADLPLPAQVKLLRAIQEKSVRPVGAQHEVPVDARIISASHRDLNAEVEAGRFRQDLYYRINVIALRMPALRERPQDIPDLAQRMLERIARRQGAQGVKTLSPAAVEALKRHPFPGNVRELENVLERATALCDGALIEVEDLYLPKGEAATAPNRGSGSGAGVPLESYLGEIEKQAILEALDETRWNRTAAARKLGMTLRSLRYRLAKLGIE